LSNLYGYDKASFDDREIFATQHMADVYDSAENPISVRNLAIIRRSVC
jgi:DNA-directed RNA polymerase